jgi:hypothetical protein
VTPVAVAAAGADAERKVILEANSCFSIHGEKVGGQLCTT